MSAVLEGTYSLAGDGSLQCLHAEMAQGFAAAFAAAESDLREWMPSTAKEQESATAFVNRCVDAFKAGTTFAYGIVAGTGDVIGFINITPSQAHAVVGYWVHPQWRGQRIAARAVLVLVDAVFASMPNVERVHAHLDAANVASRRVLDNAGFVHQGSYTRPPRTTSESDTEWLFVRQRYPRGIETRRLRLRDVRPEDLHALVGLWTDDDVGRFMDDFGPRTPDEVASWIEEALHAARSVPRFRSWVLELKATGEVVGWIGFGGDSRGVGDIDFAYVVDRGHRRRGYAAEALRGAISYCFGTLGARSFWGQCHTANEASASAMRAAGLQYIGTVDGQHRFRISRS